MYIQYHNLHLHLLMQSYDISDKPEFEIPKSENSQSLSLYLIDHNTMHRIIDLQPVDILLLSRLVSEW